ncbi:MAG TPA: NifB/NifX family molybdenum-iron cluster-binding protein [Prolixibacteraceae bacterium]|nr:NifB/NifX family molybdenum-iron cluster-binding protein [Prolixibacteraceae bacterium]
MKAIISSIEPSLSSIMDKRFGRAKWFCIYDTETKEHSFIENPFHDSQGGAGVKTAELAVEKGAKKVISGHYGPKAKEILEKFNIQMVEIEEEYSINKIIEMIK